MKSLYSQNILGYYKNKVLNANKLKLLRLARCKKKITASKLISEFVRKSGTFAGGFETEHLGVLAGKANQGAKWTLKFSFMGIPSNSALPKRVLNEVFKQSICVSVYSDCVTLTQHISYHLFN